MSHVQVDGNTDDHNVPCPDAVELKEKIAQYFTEILSVYHNLPQMREYCNFFGIEYNNK